MAFIYQIRREGTDQCYVGHTTKQVELRWAAHLALLGVDKHHSRYLQRAWNKDGGVSAFTFELIEECADADKLVREQYYIDTFDSCFNTARVAGSRLGVLYTAEQKIRLSAQRMGHSTTEEAKRKIGEAHKGKQWKLGYKLTPEQRERQWWNDPEKRKAAALKRVGSKRTDEQRARMALAQQNNPLAGQHRIGVKDDPEYTARRLVLARAGIAANPMVWITNGSETRKIPAADPIPDGFRKGRTFSDEHKAAVVATAGPRTDEAKAKMRASRLKFVAENPDRHAEIVAAKRTREWYTDGTNQQQVAEGEMPPAGWHLGMATKRGGVKWVTNGIEGRRIPEGEAPPDGWWFGFPPTKRHPSRVVAPAEPKVQKKGRYDMFDPNEDLDLAAD